MQKTAEITRLIHDNIWDRPVVRVLSANCR
jgi:hypothetical protein